jgi:hypothetical protein
MSTPPPERVAVKTYVSAFSNERALSAIKFELQRGGQVFYAVPRIKGDNFEWLCFMIDIQWHMNLKRFVLNSSLFAFIYVCLL